jgi:hypothetical protein
MAASIYLELILSLYREYSSVALILLFGKGSGIGSKEKTKQIKLGYFIRYAIRHGLLIRPARA